MEPRLDRTRFATPGARWSALSAWLVSLVVGIGCESSTPSPTEPSQSRSRALAICSHQCVKARSVAGPLGCEPPPPGCEELCMAVFASSVARCMDVAERFDACSWNAPPGAFVCTPSRKVDRRPTTCAAEKAALEACSGGAARDDAW